MAHNRESVVFNPSSPRSSVGGAESFKGTPDTRLTAFSPEEGSARSSRLLKSLGQDSPDTTPSRFHSIAFGGAISNADKDPFVTTTSNVALQKLSPTASAFQPFVGPVATPDHVRRRNRNLFSPSQKEEGELSQYLSIWSSSRTVNGADLMSCFTKLQRLGLLVQEPRQIHHRSGRAIVHFGDIRDSVLIHDNLHRVQADFEVEYMSEAHFSEHAGQTPMKCGSWVSILAIATPLGVLDISRLEAVVKRHLQAKGHLLAYHTQQVHDEDTYKAFAEFSDASEALSAVVSLDNRIIEGAHISLSSIDTGDEFQTTHEEPGGSVEAPGPLLPSQDLTNAFQALAMSKNPTQMGMSPHGTSMMGPGSTCPPFGIQVPPFAMWPILCQPQFQPGMGYLLDGGSRLSLPPATSSPAGFQFVSPLFSPQARGLSTAGSMSCSPKPEPRRQNASRVNRSPYYNVTSHHNHVDVNRIREGTDVRTTIMLRNIPNKVDQAMLKRIVDESSWGKYDFMYLRIDFANDCNVGYAFINFVDPLDIIDFVNTRGNQRWNCFKSDKVAEISYATIQGKDCLVQKFRNSSVMLEAAHYRPKLFYTSNGPIPELAGEEEPFPQPDNQSKMKRSCENAEHVGLFTPNAGQHFRDEQRRRRSQYDRGTRLAALEEHDFETNMQSYMYHQQ
ncbi:Meiosis protein mei2 [Colletotrichum aenigma]|uniref:Meiosis protein mei2 n=1 Tax=Colletotrichum aenigma TaxID=1215731 RepID=UPI0018728937|nr:Meiosis protein mei2 [Colletotrichum aenigma]KAF5522616.1 Meiosis protein mei2 [Colletotrichum aenigma]